MIAIYGLLIFLLAVGGVAAGHFGHLFADSHGRSHRLFGLALFFWLFVGTGRLLVTSEYGFLETLVYDVVLGVLGVTTTLTAARDFPHRYVANADGQSGTLSQAAMVTYGEMIEHSFYQGLNLCQALYLHYMAHSPRYPALALAAVTAPWLARSLFPVHSFSANWRKTPVERRTRTETLLYRIKKAQYLFYKHVVLHGLNLSLFATPSALVYQRHWRCFWLALNTAYVMEFFLQSLVRRHVLAQPTMLGLNRWLMLVSSVAVLPLWPYMDGRLAVASLLGNIVHRGHDFANTMILAAAVTLAKP